MPDVLTITMWHGTTDEASYAATTSLDAILEWFIEDGYTDADLLELIEGKLETLREDS